MIELEETTGATARKFAGIDLDALYSTVLPYAQNPRVWVPVLAALLLFIVLLMIRARMQPSTIRAFSNDKGYVEISRTALVELIKTTSARLGIERKPRVRIHTRGRRLHLDVRIRMTSDMRLTDISATLQQVLQSTLHEAMGIERLGNINVRVTGIRPSQADNRPIETPLIQADDYTLPEASTANPSASDPLFETESEASNWSDTDTIPENNPDSTAGDANDRER